MSNDKKVFLDELRKSRTVLCKRAATSLSTAWGDINNQQTEINDQQRKIEDKTRLIKQVDKANSQMATEINELNETCNHQEHCNDELRKEIAELKVMVNALRGKAEIVVNTGGFMPAIFGLESAIKSTPAQCLAHTKADAIKECAEVLFNESDINWQDADKIIRYANKLREQKS